MRPALFVRHPPVDSLHFHGPRKWPPTERWDTRYAVAKANYLSTIFQRTFDEETLSFPGFYSVTIVCTEDSEKLSLAGDYLLSVSPEQLKLCKRESQNIAAVQWHLEDIPRFRLQRLCHLHDGEKIFIINVARYVCVKVGGRL